MQRSHTSEGFHLLFRRPLFGLTEIVWRWSIGTAAVFLTLFSFLEYFDTLPVSNTDLLLLKLRHPVFISQAMAHIFHGSAPRAVGAALVLGMGLTAGWIVVASIGRAATLHGLLGYFREQVDSAEPPAETPPWRLQSLLGLNFLRAATGLAAIVGLIGAIVLASLASPDKTPSPLLAFLVFLVVLALTVWAWSTINWLLSLAALFVVREGRNTLESISAVVTLCRNRMGTVAAPGTWFGLVHLVLFVAATTVVSVPLALAGILPRIAVLGSVLLITLAYFAVADFLYVGRLAAYVSILERPEPPPPPPILAVLPTLPIPTEDELQLATESAAVDQDEVILSDVPLPEAPNPST